MFRRRVLLLTETFPPEVGGVQHYLAGLWNALPQELASAIAPTHPAAAAWDAKQRYHIVRASMRGWTYPRWRPALYALKRAVETMKPEVIVCGKALFEGRAVLAMNAKRAEPIPYVVIAYAMEIEEWLSRPKTRRDLLRVLASAARVVVINDKTKQRLLESGIRPEQVVKIYPGVNEAFFSPAENTEEYRRALGWEGKRILTTVCRLVPRKGVDVTLHALPEVFKRIPDLVYCIAGEGPEEERLKKKAQELGIAEHVRFLGKVAFSDLRKLLSISEVFILTPVTRQRDWEGFGMVYIEAAAMGKPSIGSDSGGVPESVLHEKTGLIVPEQNVEKTAEAVIRLLTDDAFRERLGTAAHARAEEEFHWQKRALLFRGMLEAAVEEEKKREHA